MTVTDPTNEHYSTFQQSPVVTRPRIGMVLHHAATTNMDQVIQMETTGSREVSSNRVIKDNRIAKIANDPDFRAWSLADARFDSILSSVECANESTNGWTISDASHESLAKMVAFWAQRDGFRPHREGDPRSWTVFGHREIYTIFGASYATACPGGMNLNWIAVRAQQILAGDPKPVPIPPHKYWRPKMFGIIKGNKRADVAAVRLEDQKVLLLDSMAKLSTFASAGYSLQIVDQAEFDRIVAGKNATGWS